MVNDLSDFDRWVLGIPHLKRMCYVMDDGISYITLGWGKTYYWTSGNGVRITLGLDTWEFIRAYYVASYLHYMFNRLHS